MLPLPDSNGNISGKCQLVVLDTMVHMTQKFILTEAFEVQFKLDFFKSCALVSESACLVFTEKSAILVSLIEQTQRTIRLPQGIGRIVHSLNVMTNGTPYLLVAT